MNDFLKSKPFGVIAAMGRASLAKAWYADGAATLSLCGMLTSHCCLNKDYLY